MGLGLAVPVVLSSGRGMGAERILEEGLRRAFAAGDRSGLHSALILHNGQTPAEVHSSGADERWGAAPGVREHGPDSLHGLRAVTKSITDFAVPAIQDE